MKHRARSGAAFGSGWGPALPLPFLSVGLIVVPPLYTAEIVAKAGDFRVVSVVDKLADVVVLTRTQGRAPAGRILEVWAHGPNAPAESVGLWPEGDVVPLPARIAAVEGVLTIDICEEPPAGSPTGSPSGRVFGTLALRVSAPPSDAAFRRRARRRPFGRIEDIKIWCAGGSCRAGLCNGAG